MEKELSKGPFYILLLSVFPGLPGLGIVIPLLPIFVENPGARAFRIGALFAGYGRSRIFFTPAIGNISDRYGRKWFITGGLAMYTLFSLISLHLSMQFLFCLQSSH